MIHIKFLEIFITFNIKQWRVSNAPGNEYFIFMLKMQKSNQMASFSIHFPNINGLQLLCEIRVIAGWSFWGCSDFKSQNVKKKKKVSSKLQVLPDSLKLECPKVWLYHLVNACVWQGFRSSRSFPGSLHTPLPLHPSAWIKIHIPTCQSPSLVCELLWEKMDSISMPGMLLSASKYQLNKRQKNYFLKKFP